MTDSAPTGEDVPIPKEEAIERVLDLPREIQEDDEGNVEDVTTLRESDRTLHNVLYTGGDTEYAHIYMAWVSGEYNGNRMLWIRYVWLSKPGAYDSDQWGTNGISVRLVEGMARPFSAATSATCNQLRHPSDDVEGLDPGYFEVSESDD